MTEGATERAKAALEQRRATDFPDVPSELVAAVYELEHSRQFETDRGPTRAEVRDLIKAAADDG